ncbi:hypothetical protein DQ04_01141050 [Trypanosoma grayi]|uniref:hypothetical protein n=1 Tax=Trypanosoma grayi TaxID=71804 RepID=UPI0004F44D4E|nr:hypothetical protein DQ04_01141050 [Trypanosoma grayi]KEG13219.1 hypothetical protein DQ04_01141050 [Trypanosoma grayi]
MSQRYRGRSYQAVLRKLPRNLVGFDGHCLMCQARVQYVLERNFSFFSILSFSRDIDPVRLEANKVLFCSFDSVEWREVRRWFPHLTQDAEGIVLVEKVPSKTATFLSSVRRRQRKQYLGAADSGRNGRDMFPLDPSSGASRDSGVGAAEDLDIVVSVRYVAVCRVGMKLDRWLPRTICRFLYYAVPQWVGDRWYDRVVARRRLWGTSEEDAVRYPKRVLGLKERTWRLRDK